MLDKNPEGLVIYRYYTRNDGSQGGHAVLLTRYEKETASFYVWDSGVNNVRDGFNIHIDNSYIRELNLPNQQYKIETIYSFWIVMDLSLIVLIQ
jgi:hypothetical protein